MTLIREEKERKRKGGKKKARQTTFQLKPELGTSQT
jgi:hypothetical protein